MPSEGLDAYGEISISSTFYHAQRPGSYLAGLTVSRCVACDKFTVWVGEQPAWPVAGRSAPLPSDDMPEDVRSDFEEAALIAQISPRSAAALLRLSIEKLCRHLGKSGSIDKMIGDLVKDGLNSRVQKALDIVRVTGNEAVHPGTMDLKDNLSTVSSLFMLVNLIIERTLTENRHIDEAFESLPKEKLEGIERRNLKARGDDPKQAS